MFVEFINYASLGLDCDVTYHNPLAIKNTLLLRAYSEIDPRVRIVAYIIKYWAKSRQINNPADGTLSSYGFVLCFIHFLQMQPHPILPNLQAIPMDWSGEVIPSNYDMPKAYETNIVDGSTCNVAYHHPTLKTLPILKANASKNLDSPALLLIKFFQYFAWNFDYLNDVVSIRSAEAFPGQTHSQPSSKRPTKIEKAEWDGWIQHDRLSIEDPFETWYDVAHVIKKTPMKYMKKEFLRAYTLISRAGVASSYEDSLPATIDPKSLLEIICEPCDPPPFARDNKKKLENDDKEEDEDDNL